MNKPNFYKNIDFLRLFEYNINATKDCCEDRVRG